MSEILKEVLKFIPDQIKVSSSGFEGANIILYTNSESFFLDDKGSIKNAVDNIKKRIELRADPSITMDLEKAKEVIEKIIPKEARIANVIFDPQRSRVIIEAEKPGLAIGKKGEVLREIKEKTLWTPLIHRTPAIRSKMIENIRHVLYENSDFRRKFLDKVGKRIYNGWIRGKKQEWIRVSFLGGAREVGRSCLFLQTPESRILIDCGINVAATSDENAYPYFDCPEFKINELDAVIITHAHLDHSACVPLLMKYGYEGPIYCTAPTRDVMALLALDYVDIAQKELKKSLYGATDIKNMVKHTICLNYEEVFDITPDVRLTLYNAGHTLGSAMVHLHIGNGLHNLLITGDLNYETSNLLAAAVTRFPRLETLIMESTYGGKEDNPATRRECEKQLFEIIKKTIDRKGKVLMPVLGVGRSQEIMLILERAIREGLIKDIPIFIQGMVWDITAIHTAYPDFFNNIVKRLVFHQDKNPFTSGVFKRVGSYKEMMEVVEEKGPCVIMATSGMMQGGASVEYFKRLADNPKNSLVITSYQGIGSLGRRIQEGEKEIAFSNGDGKAEIIPVKLEVYVIQGFTGHSTRDQLTSFVHRLQPKPRKIILVHGDNSKCLELASSLHKINRIETNAPKNLETIRLK